MIFVHSAFTKISAGSPIRFITAYQATASISSVILLRNGEDLYSSMGCPFSLVTKKIKT